MKIFLLSLLLFFTACNESKPTKNYDGKKLLEQKCASCHDLHIPPHISDDELAPPMMAISFHVHNFVTPSDESQRTSKAEAFVVDYALNPSLEKSFCDEDSLKRYGLMESQKGNVSEDELSAIAKYMFQNYTQKNLTKAQELQNKFDAMPQGKKIAIKYKCLGCHKENRDLVGPSFVNIAKKYKDSATTIENSIQNGTQHKWENFRGVMMPPFKNIEDEELKSLLEWILQSKP